MLFSSCSFIGTGLIRFSALKDELKNMYLADIYAFLLCFVSSLNDVPVVFIL